MLIIFTKINMLLRKVFKKKDIGMVVGLQQDNGKQGRNTHREEVKRTK